MQSVLLCFISQGPGSFIKTANGFSYQAAQAVPVFVDENHVILRDTYKSCAMKSPHEDALTSLSRSFCCPAGECVDPLVSSLYASSFLASSRYNFLYSANFAKLYGKYASTEK